MNKLREKLAESKTLLGTLACFSDPAICEIIGNVGYDVVWIDMEHTYMSYKEVLTHISCANAAGIASLVRVTQDDLTATKKVLEMGPDAILFPMVKSYEEAKRLIDTTLYPPDGTRGFGPMRAIGYNSKNSVEYVKKGSFELCRFIQIENIGCIEELEKIATIPYLDGFIFGPNDLSGSIGEFMNVFGEKNVANIKKATEIAKKHNKIIGLSGGMDEKTVKIWSSLGLDILFAGADWNFLYASAKETLDIMKKYN